MFILYVFMQELMAYVLYLTAVNKDADVGRAASGAGVMTTRRWTAPAWGARGWRPGMEAVWWETASERLSQEEPR